MSDIDNLNHVGIAVRDLADTARRFEAMGFVLTPYSPHSGAWRPSDPVQPLGSGNRCVMFANDYLEILASEDPTRPAPRLTNFLKHHQGAHILCFNTAHPHEVERRLKAEGIATSGVVPLQREIDMPEGRRIVKFARLQFAPEHSPEGCIQAVEHLTPQYVYQPRYIAHPNGCDSLRTTFLVTNDLSGFASKYRQYTGLAAKPGGHLVQFDFPLGARLIIVEAEYAPRYLPGSLFPPLPAIAGVAFRCPDLDAQRAHLAAQGFAFAEAEGRLVIPAEQASGVAVAFEQ